MKAKKAETTVECVQITLSPDEARDLRWALNEVLKTINSGGGHDSHPLFPIVKLYDALAAIEARPAPAPASYSDEELLTLLRGDPDGYIRAVKRHRESVPGGKLAKSIQHVQALMDKHGITRQELLERQRNSYDNDD